MRKILLIIVAFSFLLPAVNAQLWKLNRYELSGGVGTTNIYGDVGGYSIGKNMAGLKDFTFLQTSFNIEASFRYRFTERISGRVNLDFGRLHATDIRGSNEYRSYESKTTFFEPAIIGEYYFIRNKGDNSYLSFRGKNLPKGSFTSMLDAYFFTGFGGISYNVNPNAALEARAMPVSGFAVVIPVGAGVNFNYSRSINLGIELSGRYSFTDYLDGYTSQFSKRNDVYYLMNFVFTYKMLVKDNGFPSFRSAH